MLENEDGGRQEVDGAEFARVLRRSGVRLVVLSACQSAQAAHHAAFRDVGSQLIAAGVAASLAMQYPVDDRAATAFAGKLYWAVCAGQDVHRALARARRELLTERTGPAAHSTPVAFVADPECLRIDQAASAPARRVAGPQDFGLVPKLERGFVARGRELRLLWRNFSQHRWSAAVIYGLGASVNRPWPRAWRCGCRKAGWPRGSRSSTVRPA